MKFDSTGLSQYNPNGSTEANAAVKMWDNAGLLLGLRVSANGTIKTGFGVKYDQNMKIGRPAEGIYQIPHNFSHTDYTAQAIVEQNITDQSRVAKIMTATENETTIKITNDATTNRSNDFQITFFGRS